MFVWKFDFSLAYLAVEMDSGTILLLRMLYTDPAFRNPGAPDSVVSGPYHSDGDPTPDIPACPVVGLPPLGIEATG